MSQHPERETATILDAVMALSDDGIVIQDVDGVVRSWSGGAERIFGYTAGEMIGRPISTLVPPDDVVERERVECQARAGQRIETYETVRLAKGGHRIRVSATFTPVRNANAELTGGVVLLHDLMAQRRVEDALRRSEAQWRAIVESAVDAIILISKYGVIEAFNAAAERLFGYTSPEAIGRNVSMLMPEPHVSEHDHYLRRYQMTGERRIIGIGRKVTARRKDGTLVPVHLSVGELTLDGETKFTGIVHDLTERVALQTRLNEEAGLVRIGELAAVLAHEVKNPLAAVSGAIQMLAEHLPAPEDQEIVSEVIRRLEALGALMTDLLLYARPPRPQMTDLDLVELLHALVNFLRSDAAWKDLNVEIHGTEGRLSGDPELLRIALQNLLLNAAQAMNGQGRIRVAIDRTPDRVVIDIEDAGPGIPAEVRSKLFTPFFTTKARGTGLGLATTRRILESQGGAVAVVSSGPTGTVMRVTLSTASGAWHDS